MSRRDYDRDERYNDRRRPGFFHKLGKFILGVFCIIGVISVVLFIADKRQSNKAKNASSREAIIQEEEKFHDIILSNDTIAAELDDISELMTYSEVYAGTATIVDSRQIPYTDIDIWGTQHTISIQYSGTIKVGYNLDEMKTVVNNQKKEIYITLPTTRIVDNNLPQENVTCIQDNNIFNSIRADEVNVRLTEVKAEQMQNAIDNGIYEKADQHLREIIIDKITKLCYGYEVVFVDPSLIKT